MAPPRPPADRGFVSLQVLAATMVVVIAVTGLLVSGAPERVSCEVGQAITSVTGGGPLECEDTSFAASPGGSSIDPLVGGSVKESGDEARPRAFTVGGLTAETFSAVDSVASPAIRDAEAVRAAEAVVAASDARCALAPDRGTWESKICVIADSEDPQEAAAGSQLVVRCATEVVEPTTGTCFPTSDDDARGHRSAISTAATDGQTRFCQPLRADRTDPRADSSPFRVDWACASWAGNLYHCSNVLSADLITTGRSNSLVNYTEPTTWVTDPDFRDTWPATCGSRTFGPGMLACTADPTSNPATNLAACDIRAFQGLPLRSATCVSFHPRAGEDATRSNTIRKPMHCRLDDAAAGTLSPSACAPSNLGRGLTADRERVRLAEIRCAATVRMVARARPTVINLTSRGGLEALRSGRPPHFLVSTIGDRPRFRQDNGIVQSAAFTLVGIEIQLDQLDGGIATLPTVFVIPTGEQSVQAHGPSGEDNFVSVVHDARQTSLLPSDFASITWWVVRNIGVVDRGDTVSQGIRDGLREVLGYAMAEDDPDVPSDVRAMDPSASVAQNGRFLEWVYARLRQAGGGSNQAAAVVTEAARRANGTAAGFVAALPQAIQLVGGPSTGTLGGAWAQALASMQSHPAWPGNPPLPTTINVVVRNPDGSVGVGTCSVTVCQGGGSAAVREPRPTLTLRPDREPVPTLTLRP